MLTIPDLARDLPITEVLPELMDHLNQRDELVLEAPPGAGKTTLVPLALLQAPWLGSQKILVLEPRRVAARAAANRLAMLLGEQVGQTVGYRMRLDTRVGPATRIEVITEGIMTRMLSEDPALSGVGAILFDEFHERSLDADLALALALKSRELFRESPLKLLVMSATLESKGISRLLNDAPVVSSLGRTHPVTISYTGAAKPRERIADRVSTVVQRALDAHPTSNLLVFLPGQGEIRQVEKALANRMDTNTSLWSLHGNLSLDQQQSAIDPPAAGKRKVVLATNIAETSLTIEGVDVVIDSGLERAPVFDPATAMTRLQTRRISRASSIQRAGRAGRLKPGTCYRLWSEGQQQELAAAIEPEILQADLSQMALQLLDWGIPDPAELGWLTPPPAGAWQQALALLELLGATEPVGASLALTRHGASMAKLPLPPRLSHLLLSGVTIHASELASQLAALLSERDPFDEPDLRFRLQVISGKSPCPPRHRGWQSRVKTLARQFLDQVRRAGVMVNPNSSCELEPDTCPGFLIACAFPDRISRQRHSGGYQLANGRSANLPGKHPLSRERWLAVADVSGLTRSKGDTIRAAVPVRDDLFESLLAGLVTEVTTVAWDAKAGRFVAERKQQVGRLVLARTTLDNISLEARTEALVTHLQVAGLNLLPWTTELRQWQARVMLARTHLDGAWPDVSDPALLEDLNDWLGPYLTGVTSLTGLKKLDLSSALKGRLAWEENRQLDHWLPERYQVPSGSALKIDYLTNPPVLAVKLQEMFGASATPTVARGQVALLVHLLSPAGRPLQITQDLAGFWATGYSEVRKEMKGRYPKHPWPEDPLKAPATHKTQRALDKGSR